MNFLSSFLSSSNRSRMYRGIVTFTVLVIGIGWVVTILYLRDDRQREIAQVMQANANLARAFEEHTIRTIKQIDQLVLLAGAQYERLGAKLDLARFVREAGANPELIVIIAVLDERGNAVITNTSAPPANVADRDHFKFHSQHDSGKLFVGKAVMGRLGGRWLMPMSRRINKPDGSFGGAVSIGVDPLYFSNFYRDIDLGKDGVASLGGRDGFIRSRLSGQEPGAGQDVRNTPIVNAIERGPQGSLIFTSIVDGISRIWSYRALRDYPLYVTVGVSESEALATHDRLQRGSYVAAGIATLLILAFCGWLLRLDIREQKARAALTVTEQREAALLDSIPDCSWLKDSDGRFLAVNRAYARALGIEPEAAIGKTTHDFLPADAAERSAAEDQQVLSSGKSLRIERRLFFRNDLAWYDVIKVPIKDRHGRASGVVCIARDITERRVAQAEVETLNAKLRVANDALERRVAERTAELEIANSSLRESEARYRAVAQSANAAIVTADVAGNIAGWNRGAEIIFGYTQAEINGQPLTLLMPYLYRDRHLTDMNRVHSGGKPHLIGATVELKGLRKDKSEFPLELSLAKWETAEGHFVTGIIRDITERKRAEETREKLAAIVENANEAIFSRTLDGTILSWNAGAEKMLGYTAAEAIGKPIAFTLPLDRPPNLTRNNESLLRGEVVARESDRMTKDGRVIDVMTSHSPIRDSAGNIVGASIILQDITALKQAQAAAKASEERFRATFDQAAVGIVHTSFDGKYLQVNQKFCDMLGYSESELVGRAAADFTHSEDRESGRQYRQLMWDGKLDKFAEEKRYLRKDGSVIWTNRTVSLARDASGKPLYFIRVIEDITERKEVEERYRATFDNAPVGIMHTAIDGYRILRANRKLCEMLGYTQDELLGMTSTDVVHPDYRFSDATRYKEPILNDALQSFASERKFIRKDGSLLWVNRTVSLVRNAAGEPLYFIRIIEDITQRKQAEAARASLEAQLRESQKMEAIGTLAGGIAHDFNNALATILGNVELARQDVSNYPLALQSLEEIRKAGARARDLVQQILSFSRRQPTERKLTALAPIVEESVRLLRATLPARLRLEVHCDDDVPPVLAHATQIQQVVINLTTNAMQAMRNGPGRIDIRLDTVMLDAALADAHPVLRTMHAKRPGRTVRLAVSDDGPGMDAAMLGRIFDPFFTTKQVDEGTGLGLSVVHGIVQAHEGAIAVDSQPGKGATFTLYLPAAEAEAGAPEPRASAAAATATPHVGGGQHILYLDDDDSLVLLVQRLLERHGYRISGYTDQREALDALRADPAGFDLVVTDYNMPGMSGLDVAREVRTIRADLPVAVATGFIDEELRAQAGGAGVRELIFKANSVQDFCEVVQRLSQAVAENSTSRFAEDT